MNDLAWLILTLVLVVVCLLLGTLLLRRRNSSIPLASPRARKRVEPFSGEGWAIIERMAEGLLVLNDRLQPVAVNRAARRLLSLPESGLPPRLPADDIRTVARRCVATGEGAEDVVGLWFPVRKSLKVRAEPLDQGTVVMLQDVTEELRSQRLRREFVAHASHELKSPVASMQTLSEALRHAVHDDPVAADRFADRLVFEAARLGRLIGDLLDLSRLEDPESIPDESVDLTAATEAIVDEVRREGLSKKVTIKTNIGLGVHVRGDASQLKVLVRNLVENAIRYTPDGGDVNVYLRREGDEAVVRVTDTGIGIPLEAQSRVFERFYRVDRARSRDKGGTGLGLAIVKHVAELHGGAVELESEVGRGSTFSARIPIAAPAGHVSSATG
ncbi:MAG: sensor histidine kinase [Actinomycetota bacterium]